MGSQLRRNIKVGSVIVVLGALASCGPKSTPPPPPPPPPPQVVVIPPRPMPPLGASPLLAVPQLGATGVRQTINTGITSNQTSWNVRSAFNVAALNCQRPEHADILTAYKTYLKTNRIALGKVNKAVDTEFRQKYGPTFVRPREAYMTQVYNYYAFPPTLPKFCDAALVMAHEVPGLKPVDLAAFSTRNLAQMDGVFEQFYRSYEQYRADAAAWDAKYTPKASAVPVGTATTPSTK
ncbi:MAG: hypothetical protein KGM49_08690 [Sphingomonadales bacterium]|nr:hypothetical protein [Sphingomonadales bacterium]